MSLCCGVGPMLCEAGPCASTDSHHCTDAKAGRFQGSYDNEAVALEVLSPFKDLSGTWMVVAATTVVAFSSALLYKAVARK